MDLGCPCRRTQTGVSAPVDQLLVILRLLLLTGYSAVSLLSSWSPYAVIVIGCCSPELVVGVVGLAGLAGLVALLVRCGAVGFCEPPK